MFRSCVLQHLHSICKADVGFAATNSDGKIVGASFVDVHAKGSKVATLGPVASAVPGAGKKSFEAACAHAEDLGFTTLVRTKGGVGGAGLVSLFYFVFVVSLSFYGSYQPWLLTSENENTENITLEPRPLYRFV